MTRSPNNGRWQARAIILAAIAVMVGAVWFGGGAQRDASDVTAAERATAVQLLTARLDMETGLRGFLLTGQEGFLEPYRSGLVAYREAAATAEARADGSREADLASRQDALTNEWIGLSKQGIRDRRRDDGGTAGLVERKRLMDQFRRANAQYAAAVDTRGGARQRDARLTLIVLIAALGLAGLLFGYLVVERPAAERTRRRRQVNEFTEMLQLAATEREAHLLVRSELERAVPDSDAAVLAINNSENRLQPATELPDDSSLAEKLRGAAPSTCLAIRRGKEYSRRRDSEPLIECELCGSRGESSICMPSLVGGEIIGSVLVSVEGRALSAQDAESVESTATLAAPVLGNMRNLAIAETRAVTDSLTGLANSRAATETFGVMAAFAGRSGQPLSAVLVDLDHFKKINDNYGHPVGDEVLAAAAQSLKASLRASDFVARYGGEEFLVLLQGTGKDEAAEAAEKMRRDLAYIRVSGFTARVTASFGVATLPLDAVDRDALLRAADEALYSAKQQGRDRVNTYRGESILERAATTNP